MRLRVAGVLLIVGLIVEILSLFWIHPLAFLGFIIIGGFFLACGILLFLWTLVLSGKADPGA